jgi:hypothetical protein
LTSGSPNYRLNFWAMPTGPRGQQQRRQTVPGDEYAQAAWKSLGKQATPRKLI